MSFFPFGENGKMLAPLLTSAAGVMVSCKIPILVTRVRFPGGAILILNFDVVIYDFFLFPPPAKRYPEGNTDKTMTQLMIFAAEDGGAMV